MPSSLSLAAKQDDPGRSRASMICASLQNGDKTTPHPCGNWISAFQACFSPSGDRWQKKYDWPLFSTHISRAGEKEHNKQTHTKRKSTRPPAQQRPTFARLAKGSFVSIRRKSGTALAGTCASTFSMISCAKPAFPKMAVDQKPVPKCLVVNFEPHPNPSIQCPSGREHAKPAKHRYCAELKLLSTDPAVQRWVQ